MNTKIDHAQVGFSWLDSQAEILSQGELREAVAEDAKMRDAQVKLAEKKVGIAIASDIAKSRLIFAENAMVIRLSSS